jgi:acyl-CoA reductase-like NAD-dependent aldehyde dehydrogenase
MICFTGSTQTGKKLYKLAAEKFIKILLELGGSAPGIVFEDADINQVVESVYFNRFVNSGQICDGLKRLIVHESRIDEVVEALKKDLENKKIGDPEDPTTDVGPLVSQKQLDTLLVQVDDAISKGAKIEIGGRKPEGLEGAYYLPTILTNPSKDMKVWTEEVFGPVLPIVAFKGEEQAVRMANHTEYGLGSYIFSKDKDQIGRVASQLQAGMVSTNNQLYLHPASPFGGYKNSGIGREHGVYGLRELCQIKVVATEK